MKKIVMTTLVATSLLAGCATQTGMVRNTTNATPTYSKSQAFFISGIGQEKQIDAQAICGGEQNVAKVESTLTPKDIGLGILTLGIYTPHTANVYCR